MHDSKIQVHVAEDGKYFLRLWLYDERAGLVEFETRAIYSKAEADYRAITLSAPFGFGRDELPTHPYIEAAPLLG